MFKKPGPCVSCGLKLKHLKLLRFIGGHQTHLVPSLPRPQAVRRLHTSRRPQHPGRKAKMLNTTT